MAAPVRLKHELFLKYICIYMHQCINCKDIKMTFIKNRSMDYKAVLINNVRKNATDGTAVGAEEQLIEK